MLHIYNLNRIALQKNIISKKHNFFVWWDIFSNQSIYLNTFAAVNHCNRYFLFYIYIYKERERETERERNMLVERDGETVKLRQTDDEIYKYIYIYIYIYI